MLQSLIDRAGLGMRLAQSNRAVLGADRYLIVRFEELTRRPEAHLRTMSDFIGVAYHPSLATPTVNGAAWPGNSFDGQQFQGLSAANVGRWPDRIEPLEAATIEFFMGDVMRRARIRADDLHRGTGACSCRSLQMVQFLEQGPRHVLRGGASDTSHDGSIRKR